MRDSINELLEEARQLEDKKQFDQARDKYAVVRGELADEIDKGALAQVDEFVIAVIGEQVCDMADHLSHTDSTFRRSRDFQRNVSELKRYVETVARGNCDFCLNALVTAFKRAELLFIEEGWDVEASPMYYEWREASRKLAWRNLCYKFSRRDIKGSLVELWRIFVWNFLWITCGYGERPWLWFVWVLIPTLIFAVTASYFNWLDWNVSNSTFHNDVGFWHSLYYAVVTFTTLGYGDIVPGCWKARFWAALLTLWGYVMLGLLVAMIARRLIRR